ncbi:MAG: hypothetical protein ACYC9L_08530 [Sulfuricaulis sp.]
MTPHAFPPAAIVQAPGKVTPLPNPQHVNPPTVLRVEPRQLATGKTYALSLYGNNFQSAMKLNFGTGIIIQETIMVLDNNHARAVVLVAPGTPPGKHLVVASLAQSTTLAAVPSLQSDGPGYIDVVSVSTGGLVMLNQIIPRQIRQGQQATLTLQGAGFKSGMAMSFGPGIVATGNVQVINSKQATLGIQVSPQAPAMLRHPTLLFKDHDVKVSPEVTLMVVANSVSQPLPFHPPTAVSVVSPSLPVVLSVEPARLFTGQSYTLTLSGLNFVPQMSVNLGAGVVPSGSLRIQSPNLATLQVDVQKSAPAGIRWVELQMPPAIASWHEDASVLVQQSVAIEPHNFTPPPDQCAHPKVPQEGTIVLDGPLYMNEQNGGAGITSDVPVLNDRTDFTWHEANSGLAERFEIRFYLKKPARLLLAIGPGAKKYNAALLALYNTPIVTRSLTAAPGFALPRSLIPDAALVAELAGKVRKQAAKIVHVNSPPDPTPTLDWDLTWQVVGYKTYYDSCVSATAARGAWGAVKEKQLLGQGHEVEVETSGKAPIIHAINNDPLLDVHAAPTGMACTSNSSLNAQNIDLQSDPNGRTASGGGYTGDRWQISGSLDLSNTPWAMDEQQSNYPSATNPPYPVESETVNNVFVDWGDGTTPTPLTMRWKGSYCGTDQKGKPVPCFASNTENSSAAAFKLPQAQGAELVDPSAQHAYHQTSASGHPFYLRIYMLPAADVQQQGAQKLSMASGGGGLYGKLLSRSGQLLGGSSTGAGADAYMIACQPITISPRHDDVSNGKLKLMAIHITGFPGDQTSGGTHLVKHGRPNHVLTDKMPPRKLASMSLPVRGLSGNSVSTGSLPQFCSCDVNLTGGASVDFYGQGTARLTWYEDGAPVGSTDEEIGPSASRTDAQLAQKPPYPAIKDTWPDLHSPALSLAQIGTHQLQVTAEVVKNTHSITGVRETLKNYATPSISGTSKPAPESGLSGAPPLGVLGPRGAAIAGLPPVVWVNQAPAKAFGISLHLDKQNPLPAKGGARLVEDPPLGAVSAPVSFQITSADPKLPCTFNFPVKGGSFTIGGLQHGGKATIQQRGASYSGNGTLNISLADSTEQVPIHLNGWTMQSDGVTVANGGFNVNPGLSRLPVPGLKVSVDKITGIAGDKVTATLSASLSNTDILSSTPPPWTNVQSTLSPQGDWCAGNLPITPLEVYDSGFTLTARSATLDLSQDEGGASCQTGSGIPGWMGVLLNQASLTAFNFNLQNPPTMPVSGWAIDSYGFSGQAQFPKGSATLDQGSLAWDSISASAAQGSFTATYNGLKVHVPWLNVDLTSPQAPIQLTAGQGVGQGGINLNFSEPTQVTLTEGPITLTANNLSFGSIKGLGWAVKSDTTLNFKGQQGQFASGVVLNGFAYGMDGNGYFEDGSSSRHINLSGQKGAIGGSLVDLKSVDVQVGGAAGNQLSFAFDTTLNLSKTLGPADVAASYSINEPSQGQYLGAGPVVSPFKLVKDFPDNALSPTIHLSMTPQLKAGGGSKSSYGVLFSSNLDMGMFGGPPVSGQFVLGYVNSDDYWVASAALDLGPTGISLAPLPISLYKVGGGMGYNVPVSAFQSNDLSTVVPSDDGTYEFDASLLVGTSDHTTAGLLGNFTVKPGGQDPGGRMDYHAWLLNPDWTGQSPIYGYFSYSGGTFDGTLNAQLSLLNDQVALNATHDAIHMHVGGGLWYYHIGTENNPIDGHVFFEHGQVWADLGSDGFMLGLIAKLDLDAGDCGDACAYIHDQLQLNASVTPAPLAFSAKAQENFNLGGCIGGQCLNANESTSVSLGLPPPYLNFGYSISMCPPAYVNVGLQVLPSVNPNIGGGFCSGINL